jgi:hypothetical protein
MFIQSFSMNVSNKLSRGQGTDTVQFSSNFITIAITEKIYMEFRK